LAILLESTHLEEGESSQPARLLPTNSPLALVSGDGPNFVAPPPAAPVERGQIPTFSVIVPTYQAAETVADAVASVLAQTTPAHEIIVCDDGSTDDTAAALEPYLDRITYLWHGNEGAAAARNRGIRAASGEFVTTLDSDDVWLPRYLEAVGMLAAARPDLDLLSTDVWFEIEGEIVGRFYAENPFSVTDQRKAILINCFVGWPAARRSRILEAGGFDESLLVAHDWDAWLRLIFAGSRAGLVDEPLVRYRVHGGSLTANRARSFGERARVLDKARQQADLQQDELEILEASRREALKRARLAEARSGLLERRPGARRHALAAAAGRGLGLRNRVRLCAEALAVRRSAQPARGANDERAPRLPSEIAEGPRVRWKRR
jgi:GT2 family glycosyltransferase